MANVIGKYRQAEDYFFRGISSKCLKLGDDVTACMTAVPVADLNLIYIQKATHNFDKILRVFT